MARNEEKSQSMLFRFREAQAAELGLSGRTDRRPRVANTCKDLRQCERWRGEILREIGRKVSKIQDSGLTDYEVRDLNDEINKLLREKFHWENQIVALGGANYKRAAGKMMGPDGKEVPGARGYKYFGRAKDLPGVKELFRSTAENAAELESFKTQKIDMFSNVGPGYYGELDEQDGELLKFEQAAEAEAWEDALEALRLSHPSIDISHLTAVPQPSFISLDNPTASSSTLPPSAEDEIDEEPTTTKATGNKRKGATTKAPAAAAKKTKVETNGFYSILLAEELRPPVLATPKEMEAYIIKEQKRVLLEQYGA